MLIFRIAIPATTRNPYNGLLGFVSVAGNMELNKKVSLLLEKGIVTSTGITKEGYYMVNFEGEPDTCFFTFKPGNVNILTNAWFTTNNSLRFSHNNGILNVVYADGTGRIMITRI